MAKQPEPSVMDVFKLLDEFKDYRNFGNLVLAVVLMGLFMVVLWWIFPTNRSPNTLAIDAGPVPLKTDEAPKGTTPAPPKTDEASKGPGTAPAPSPLAVTIIGVVTDVNSQPV